jgi:transcriptional regulator with XRE-family HTH domain
MADLQVVVARHMEARGLSLRGLARAAHCDPSYLSRALRGIKPCGPALARAIDDALDADGAIIQAAARSAPLPAPGRPHEDSVNGSGNAQAREMISAIAAALHVAPDGYLARDTRQLEHDVMCAWELRQSTQYAQLGELLTSLLRDVGSHHAGSASAPPRCA